VIAATWLGGLLRRRGWRVAGTACGVALAVALLGSLGGFVGHAKATMTRRAIANVAVDWQVQGQQGVDAQSVLAATRADPHVALAQPVEFGTTSGLQANAGGSVQSTGPGQVVGLPAGYATAFPGEVRPLVGPAVGVLLAQQTAANLHAGIGDTVSIGLAGLPAMTVRVDGVVDLPDADSFFQHVGAAAGAQAQAPPDNIVILPIDQWRTVFAPLEKLRPDLVAHQAHARLHHDLPSDPSAAFSAVSASARHLEAATSGSVRVGDNLAARLDAARSDALYSQVLFILLGLPGAIVAGLLTVAVTRASRVRRRRELALLRTRGASVGAVTRLAAVEAGAAALIGSVVGIGAGLAIGRAVFGSAVVGGSGATTFAWLGAAALAGLAIALAAVVLPARRDAKAITIAASRAEALRPTRPALLRWRIDVLLLAAAGLVFWAAGRNGYSLVLAPEGVPKVSVSYWALVGPPLLWIGAGLMAWRLAEAVLGHARGVIVAALRPFAGSVAHAVAATLSRQRRGLAQGIALVAVTVAFAGSTATFNATYRHQAAVDTVLTNGADVTVAAPPGADLGADLAARVKALGGVRSVEPLAHRFVYVGTDLQDLYGVNPQTITDAARLQNSYFTGGSAGVLMRELARQPDGALLSAETVKDFQLQLGDHVKLRVRLASGGLRDLDVRYVGVAKEFPTAPRDSFILANASYLAQVVGDPLPQTLLVQTGGASPARVAAEVRRVVGPGPGITDIETTRRIVGSSLTAVDLSGLTRVELGFGVALGAAVTGLVFGLGLAERRRVFAISRMLGARSRQVAVFVWAEAAALILMGIAGGAAIGWLLSEMLVKVLTGVFDPPPTGLSVPWLAVAAFMIVAAAATAIAAGVAVRAARRPSVEVLREA
jgi:putative ABC transport system permease protein